MIGGQSETIVTQWLLDPTQFQAELRSVAQEVRKEQREERDLTTIRKRMTGATRECATATQGMAAEHRGLSSALTMATIKGNLWVAALSAGKNMLREGLRDLDAFQGATNAYTGNLEGARRATMGMVSDLDLMQTSNRMATLGLGFMGDEYNQLLADVTKLSQATGIDLKAAMDKITNAIIRQSPRSLKLLGITFSSKEAQEEYATSIGKTVEQLTKEEKATAIKIKILSELHSRASKTREVTLGFSEDMSRLYIIAQNLILSAGRGWAWVYNDIKRNILAIRKNISEMGTLGGVVGAALKQEKRLSTWGEVTFPQKQEITERKIISERGRGKRGAISTDSAGVELGRIESEGDLMRLEQRAAALKEANRYFKDFVEFEKQYAGALAKSQKAKDKDVEYFEKRSRYHKEMFEGWKKEHAINEWMANSFTSMTNALNAAGADIKNMTVGALGSFTAGIFQAAEAARAGEITFKQAMAGILKSTLYSIAEQAIVKAVFYAAEAVALGVGGQWGLAADALVAAGLYTATAVAAGVGGYAINTGGASSAGGSATASGGASGYAPSFGQKSKQEQPIYINVYLGDPQDPSAALLLYKQLSRAKAA